MLAGAGRSRFRRGLVRGEREMPRAKTVNGGAGEGGGSVKPVRRARKDDQWGGFVPCELGVDEREAWEIWFSASGHTIAADLDDAMGTGLKFTASYDGANQCYIASLSGRPDVAGERAFTNILTGRAGTFDEAVGVLLYKHLVVLRGDWWGAVNAPKVNRRQFG